MAPETAPVAEVGVSVAGGQLADYFSRAQPGALLVRLCEGLEPGR